MTRPERAVVCERYLFGYLPLHCDRCGEFYFHTEVGSLVVRRDEPLVFPVLQVLSQYIIFQLLDSENLLSPVSFILTCFFYS